MHFRAGSLKVHVWLGINLLTKLLYLLLTLNKFHIIKPVSSKARRNFTKHLELRTHKTGYIYLLKVRAEFMWHAWPDAMTWQRRYDDVGLACRVCIEEKRREIAWHTLCFQAIKCYKKSQADLFKPVKCRKFTCFMTKKRLKLTCFTREEITSSMNNEYDTQSILDENAKIEAVGAQYPWREEITKPPLKSRRASVSDSDISTLQ